MEYREEIEIVQEVLAQTVERMTKEGHTKEEIKQITEAFNKVRTG